MVYGCVSDAAARCTHGMLVVQAGHSVPNFLESSKRVGVAVCLKIFKEGKRHTLSQTSYRDSWTLQLHLHCMWSHLEVSKETMTLHAGHQARSNAAAPGAARWEHLYRVSPSELSVENAGPSRTPACLQQCSSTRSHTLEALFVQEGINLVIQAAHLLHTGVATDQSHPNLTQSSI